MMAAQLSGGDLEEGPVVSRTRLIMLGCRGVQVGHKAEANWPWRNVTTCHESATPLNHRPAGVPADPATVADQSLLLS